MGRVVASFCGPDSRKAGPRGSVYSVAMGLRGGVAHLPLVRDLIEAKKQARWQRATGYVMRHRPGHYGSPIPALKEIRARDGEVFASPTSIPGIDLREREQLRLVEELAVFSEDQPFPATSNGSLRYHYENPWFSYSDGI